MNIARQRPRKIGFATGAPCTRNLESHRGSSRLQKPRIAIATRAPIIARDLALSSEHGLHGVRLLAEAWRR